MTWTQFGNNYALTMTEFSDQREALQVELAKFRAGQGGDLARRLQRWDKLMAALRWALEEAEHEYAVEDESWKFLAFEDMAPVMHWRKQLRLAEAVSEWAHGELEVHYG